jgi:hypothetical protein
VYQALAAGEHHTLKRIAGKDRHIVGAHSICLECELLQLGAYQRQPISGRTVL